MPSQTHVDQQQWIVTIQEALAQETNGSSVDGATIPVSIFRVSKSLLLSKPEAYIPHHVGIGPYHQWSTEIYEMERHKTTAARRMQQYHLRAGITFQDVVDQFAKLDFLIRSSYSQYLDLSADTLAWMMAVDASFLLEFLRAYGGEQTVDDRSRKTMAHNAILRDVILLENQIPLFLLTHLFGCCKQENASEALAMMLMRFCGSLIPFRESAGKIPLKANDVLEMGNLVELLYHVCTGKKEEISISAQDQSPPIEKSTPSCSLHCPILAHLFSPFLRHLRRVMTSRILKSVLKFPFRSMGGQTDVVKFENEAWSGMESLPKSSMHPLLDGLMIPTVVQLSNAGIRFYATKGDLWSIRFDKVSGTIHLPCITFDENTEVVLRNLVAFEASTTSRLQILTRYTELMNGMIDNEEDVKILREKGIVKNHLKSDKEVANRWNGMTRGMFVTKVVHLDNVIEDVNRYHSSRWRVRLGKLLEKYIYRSWPFLTFIAANLFLVLTALQAFCSVFECGEVVHVSNFGGGMMNSSTNT